jgi:hypothetical protein
LSVVADPVKLRELAKKLRASGEQLEQIQRQALGALRASGWNDKERQRFEAALSQDLKAAAAVGAKLRGDYPKALERKARALDEFRR